MHHIKVIKDGNVNNVVKEQLVDGVQYVDNEPHEGSLNGITSDAVAKVAEHVTTAEGKIDSIEEKIPSGASSSNKLVTESGMEDAMSTIGTGYTPKGNATVATLESLTGQSNGDMYIVTDSGTLNNGALVVSAGNSVAWDSTNEVWYKTNQYATQQEHDALTTYAQNVAHSIAPEFDPTKPDDEGGYAYYAGTPVMYNGSCYVFTSNKQSGVWDPTVVEKKPLSESIQLEGVSEAVNAWLDDHPEATTTVQDGSLTEVKFSDALKLQTIKDYVTPEMFGAKGDGVTDDTQALQYAFDTGKSVFIPSGKTYITTGNVVGSGVVFGNGFGSKIKAASKEQPYVLKIAGSNEVIKNICIHGSGDTDPSRDFGDAVGIVTEGSRSRINLDGVFIVCCDIGLYFDNTNWDCLFSRLTIYYCNTALKTDDAMLCCKFDSCSLSHNRTQFDLTRGTFVLFENCGIGSSTTEKFAKIYSAHSVRFFNCNFEESVVSSDSGAFEFLNQDNIIIFEGCYIRKVSKATGSSNTALFRTNTGLSRNSIIFRNSRFMANSVDYHVYVANGDQSLQFSFDWLSFGFMIGIANGGSLACNFTSANNTLFRITDVPKLRDLIDASVFGGQKFKGFQCIVGNGVRYEYDGNVFRQVPTVPEATYTGEYVLAYGSEGLFWKPDPNIYNPLNLPDYTIRFKTNAAVTQADFVKGTLSEIDGQNYIYEINYQNTDWTSVFDGNTALVEVLGANLSKVKKLYKTFFGCSNMTKCALFDTSNVTTFYATFYNCARLASAPKFLLNKATILYGMFHNCQALTSLPDLDFYVVENCSLIFEDCKNVSDGDSMTSAYGKLSALESVETYGAAFQNCGVNTTDGAAALAQIPTSWGGTAT